MNKFLTFPFEVKAAEASGDGATGFIKGLASTFGNVDLGGDAVDRGAFGKTIAERRGVFPFLLDHNPYKPAGYQKAEEQPQGLAIDAELRLHDPEVKQRYELAKLALKMGSPMGLSIGYFPVKWEMDQDGVRHLKEIKLYETSLVVFPMNEQAMVTAAKQWLAEVQSEKITAGDVVEELIAKGYSELDLLKALEGRAAKSEMKPGDIAHFVARLKDIQSILRA